MKRRMTVVVVRDPVGVIEAGSSPSAAHLGQAVDTQAGAFAVPSDMSYQKPSDSYNDKQFFGLGDQFIGVAVVEAQPGPAVRAPPGFQRRVADQMPIFR